MSQPLDHVSIGHISLTVRDMEKSLHFYRDMVGLEVHSDRTITMPDGPTDAIYEGYDKHYRARHKTARLVLLKLPGGPGSGGTSLLGLVSHPGEELRGEAIKMDDIGITHFSFMVPDKAAFEKRMRVMGATEATHNHFQDPDGILVQVEDPEFQQMYSKEFIAAQQAQQAEEAS